MIDQKCYLILEEDALWLEYHNNEWQLPTANSLHHYGIILQTEQHLLNHLNVHFYYGVAANSQSLEVCFQKFAIRECICLLGTEVFKPIGKAKQLLDWQQTHKFCGRCGTATVLADQDRARQCPQCQLMFYPKISPCVLVAVYREDTILLAHSHSFRSNIYSVLAGFIEAGESAEECARREVYEEVKIEIGELTYFGSQPWPFPNQLMLAYHAPYKSGEIVADLSEIADAGWFRFDELPQLPMPQSLAYQLIEHVLQHK
jgi:NAD+ diphosphatase